MSTGRTPEQWDLFARVLGVTRSVVSLWPWLILAQILLPSLFPVGTRVTILAQFPAYALVAYGLTLLDRRALRRLRARLRDGEFTLCYACFYELGPNAGDRCSECGAEVDEASFEAGWARKRTLSGVRRRWWGEF